jgi:hypothetical protein
VIAPGWAVAWLSGRSPRGCSCRSGATTGGLRHHRRGNLEHVHLARPHPQLDRYSHRGQRLRGHAGFFIPRLTRQLATNTKCETSRPAASATGRPSRSPSGTPCPRNPGSRPGSHPNAWPDILPVASHRSDAHSTQMCMHLIRGVESGHGQGSAGDGGQRSGVGGQTSSGVGGQKSSGAGGQRSAGAGGQEHR